MRRTWRRNRAFGVRKLCDLVSGALLCDTCTMDRSLPALIFDLDGTLTDSKPGIFGCLVKTLEERGMPVPASLEEFIGPPVEEWVKHLLPEGTSEDHAALARDYRGCYDREGWSNNAVYPGVRAMLAALNEAGFPLYVCTSKHEHFAVRILDQFELTPLFTAIYGDKIEYASHKKADLLARLLTERGLDADSVWMIGDRSFDFEAARLNGVRALAAGWGYGSAEEWAQANAVATRPADVIGLVTNQTTARYAEGAV
jgi:phosphoglycolate phosphatase